MLIKVSCVPPRWRHRKTLLLFHLRGGAFRSKIYVNFHAACDMRCLSSNQQSQTVIWATWKQVLGQAIAACYGGRSTKSTRGSLVRPQQRLLICGCWNFYWRRWWAMGVPSSLFSSCVFVRLFLGIRYSRFWRQPRYA